MRNPIRKTVLSTCLIFAFNCSALLAAPAETPVVPETRPVLIGPIDTPHPRLLITSETLERARQRYQSGDPAWQAAKTRLDIFIANGMKRDGIVLDVQTKPLANNEKLFKPMSADGHLIYSLALGYQLDGNDAYARQAIELLREMIALDLRGTINGPGQGMVLARGYVPVAIGYDLLYNHEMMTEGDRERFEEWTREIVEEIKASQQVWKDNDYFNQQDYQNHEVAKSMGILIAGLAIGDREMAQYALDHPDNDRDIMELYSGTILMPGDERHHRERGNYPVSPGEIYDRYRHDTARTNPPHPGGKGLQYTNLSLKLLTIAAEALYNNGIDLYHYTAPGGENLELSHAFYCEFYRTGDSSIQGGYYIGEDERIGKAGDSPGIFELAAYRYPDNEKLLACVREIRERPYEPVKLIPHTMLLWGLNPEEIEEQ